MRLIPVLIICQLLAACTTMDARLTLEPYTKDKTKRDALEALAERYCRLKRNAPVANRLPDFIFTTDGCSRAPDDHWAACCVMHDIPYWCGGSRKDREVADQLLEQCVNQQATFVGSLFYTGVRFGGTPWLPTPWRWGYGWADWPHGYDPLAHSPAVDRLLEQLQVKKIILEQLQKK